METAEIDVFASSPLLISAPIGPSQRRYANAAVTVATRLDPPTLLERLQGIEAHFGRQRRGQRWRARTLDIDILLWSGGIWTSQSPVLAIPHPLFRRRGFVLSPARSIAPDWRDPVTGLRIQHLFHRLNRPNPLDQVPKRD